MEEENYDIRQEASAIVINECKKWLLQIMEEEMDKMRQELSEIAKSRLTVEQIAAAFEEDTNRITEGKSATVTTKLKSG